MDEFEKIRSTPFCNYNRKSSETEDRQVLSIGAQEETAQETALRYRVTLDKDAVFSESKSAKTKYNRVEYARMLQAIRDGKYRGIIVWHANRLSRNPHDVADLIELFDQGKLDYILTSGQLYRNTPVDKYQLHQACGQAKMENDQKGIDVKRGLESKAKMGNYYNHPKTGYKNTIDPVTKMKVIVRDDDGDRYNLVRKMWDLLLTGAHRPSQIRELATNEWGFRMPNGKKMSRSTIYLIFQASFYAGRYEYPVGSGKWHTGNYPHMLTEAEFDLAQKYLDRGYSTRPKKKIFPYNGLMKCGECGASITAEDKVKRQKNGNVHYYTLYHCTKRKKDTDCHQQCINVKDLEPQIHKIIDKLEIPEEFQEFGLKWMKKTNEQETKMRLGAVQQYGRQLSSEKQKLSGLIDMRAGKEISPEQFAIEKVETEKSIARLQSLVDNHGKCLDDWFNTAEDMFEFIEHAHEKFNNGSVATKKEILVTLGSNLILKDKIFRIDLEKSLFAVENLRKEIEKTKERFEPQLSHILQSDLNQTDPVSASLLPDLDSNQDNLLQREMSYH